jgi:hypothetical protein
MPISSRCSSGEHNNPKAGASRLPLVTAMLGLGLLAGLLAQHGRQLPHLSNRGLKRRRALASAPMSSSCETPRCSTTTPATRAGEVCKAVGVGRRTFFAYLVQQRDQASAALAAN